MPCLSTGLETWNQPVNGQNPLIPWVEIKSSSSHSVRCGGDKLTYPSCFIMLGYSYMGHVSKPLQIDDRPRSLRDILALGIAPLTRVPLWITMGSATASLSHLSNPCCSNHAPPFTAWSIHGCAVGLLYAYHVILEAPWDWNALSCHLPLLYWRILYSFLKAWLEFLSCDFLLTPPPILIILAISNSHLHLPTLSKPTDSLPR